MKTMLDTITPGVLPKGEDAYAGYVAGHWPDFEEIKRDFPNAYVVSIAIQPDETAEFCDCEAGDFSPSEVVPWIMRMHKAGIWRPGVYASEGVMQSTIGPALSHALPRALYRKWGALWDGQRTLPFDWDAKQYQDHGPHGENYDMSVVRDDFFPHHVTHPPVPPKHGRTWEKPVIARVSFDTNTGDWTVHGEPNH